MRNSNLRTLLYDIANSESSNEIAKIIALYYPSLNTNDKKVLFESLLSQLRLNANLELIDLDFHEDNNTILEDYSLKDFRIKSFKVKSLRGIPDANENSKSYGINFEEDNFINNAIILANNGTGKSSFFSALEMVYAQEIGEKNLRTRESLDIPTDNYYDYLKRLQSKNKPTCEIETPSGIFDLDHIVFPTPFLRKSLNPSNHFISDYDIYNYGKQDFNGSDDESNSFHTLIANSLGLKDFIQFQNILNEVQSYRRTTETSNRDKLVKEKQDIGITLHNVIVNITHLTSSINNLNNLSIEEPEKSSKTESLTFINKIKSNKIELNSAISDFENTRQTFLKSYKLVLNQSNEYGVVEKEFLDAGLHLLDNSEDCPFCLNSKIPINEIIKNVEKRLSNLKEIESAQESLKSDFIVLVDILNDVYNSLQQLHRVFSEERDMINSIGELKELYEKEEQFYLKYLPIILDQGMFNFIKQLARTLSPNRENIEQFLNFINGPIISSTETILAELSELISFRNKSINDYILLIETNQPEERVKQIGVYESELKRFKDQRISLENRLKTIDNDIEAAEKEVEIVKKIKTQLPNYIQILNFEINKIVADSFAPIQSMINDILTDYLQDENISLNVHLKESTQEIEGEIQVKKTIVAEIIFVDPVTKISTITTPDKYFNTFRYKLFTLMVSLSLALATREKYKVNLPLVLDDLFSGSDFVSKNSFSEFLIKVISLFYKYTPEMPLQFILFTHDDVIFRSALDAIDYFKINQIDKDKLHTYNIIPLNEKTIVGRIFPIEDYKPAKSNNDAEFYDVLYKIPKHILIEL